MIRRNAARSSIRSTNTSTVSNLQQYTDAGSLNQRVVLNKALKQSSESSPFSFAGLPSSREILASRVSQLDSQTRNFSSQQTPPWLNVGGQQKPGEALAQYSIDLTQMALDGKLDPVIGRHEEIRRTLQILARRTKNNPILIGEPGTYRIFQCGWCWLERNECNKD